MPTKTIELKSPITWHDKQISALEIREPNALQYLETGTPWTIVCGTGGASYAIENDTAITAYLEKLLIVDGGIAIMSQLSLADGLAVKDALLSFFADAATANSTS